MRKNIIFAHIQYCHRNAKWQIMTFVIIYISVHEKVLDFDNTTALFKGLWQIVIFAVTCLVMFPLNPSFKKQINAYESVHILFCGVLINGFKNSEFNVFVF